MLRIAAVLLVCGSVFAAAPSVASAGDLNSRGFGDKQGQGKGDRSTAKCRGGDKSPAELGAAATNAATLCEINRVRAAHNVRTLRLDTRLSKAAMAHTKDMVENRYFAHDSRDGSRFSSRIKKTGWMRNRSSWSVGENLGWATGTLATPAAMVDAWMHSPGHRKNMLDPKFRVLGVGVAYVTPDGRDGATYSTEYGS